MNGSHATHDTNTDTEIDTVAGPALDPRVCRRARLSRDPRFDGAFFLAVRTTGIYCRPVCPARAPAEQNVTYYASAELAARDGYRPCLRCRPESAPGSPAWMGTSTSVRRALALIRAGALNDGSVAQLAARLGVGERYLRKLFQRELGVSPAALALNQRLLFAKKLLAETSLPMTQVAFAAGFSSVRRFNSAVRSHFRLTPQDLRRHTGSAGDGSRISLQLNYRPPYDWDGVLAFFARHAIDGVEAVDDGTYRRHFATTQGPGELSVASLRDRDALALQLSLPDQRLLMPLVARIRRMFDLDANPAAIAAVLGEDPSLRSLLRRNPGIRAPGHWSPWEAAVRAVVGQQVSTRAARGILGRFATAVPAGAAARVFPPPAALLALGDSDFPMPASRRDTLRALARLCGEREDELDLEALAALRGVGPWTVAMVDMRGCGRPDSLPLTDLGIARAWRALAGDTPLREHARHWRPWRSYAANLLWRSLSP
ncbi:MAG: 3-methyladenine DNA glycosylase 2 [Halioglobus sp.]|nr:3-methyladenine DNA glycosylase 2 [Halioglobus sp.]